MRLFPLSLSSILLLMPACAKPPPPARVQSSPDHAQTQDGDFTQQQRSEACSHDPPRPAEAMEGDFTLKAEVVVALEGGPVAVRTTLAYHGKSYPHMLHPQSIGCLNEFLGYFECNISLSKRGNSRNSWLFSDLFWIRAAGRIYGFMSFEPDQEISQITFFHDFYQIPSGRVFLNVSCPLQVKGEPEKELSTELTVDVLPATPERVAAVRRRMEHALDQPDDIDNSVGSLSRWIFGTRHHAFVPVALRIIEKYAYPLDRMLDFSYSFSDAPEEVHARMVTLACKPRWKGRVDLFRYWQDRGYDDPQAPKEAPFPPAESYDYRYWPTHRTALPPQEFGKLLKAKNLWTRILTYVTFPARCSQEWKRALLADCRQLTLPLPADQFAQLLRDLDDDSFVVREKASAKLEQFGERVEAHLKQAARMPLSLEVKRRIRFTLNKIAATPRSPDCDHVIRYLIESVQTPEADAILTVLAQGDPNIPLTNYVKTALQERQ